MEVTDLDIKRIRKNQGDEIHFYLDFRDCDWPGPGGYPCGNDIYVYYSGDDSIYIDPSSYCDHVTISEEEVYTFWDLKGKDTPNTVYFNNFWQNSLQLIPNNNHPRLVWARHPTMSGITNYRVYRAVTVGPARKPELLTYTLRATTNSSTFNWTDPDVYIGGEL